jgi:hypothetical protein
MRDIRLTELRATSRSVTPKKFLRGMTEEVPAEVVYGDGTQGV